MASRKHKAALHEKLQLLRAVTNSNSLNETSIIVDASKYIQKLKGRVDKLNEEIGTSQQVAATPTPLPKVAVKTTEKDFLINVFSENSCPGLLVFILEAFEELGLDVLDARVCCSENFQFQAVGGENEGRRTGLDSQGVKQGVIQAIKKWRENDGN